MSACWSFLTRDDADTAVEYAVLALIVLTCLVAIQGVGGRASAMWTNTKTEMEGM
jgi:Flp pilus assembly pilin Flp